MKIKITQPCHKSAKINSVSSLPGSGREESGVVGVGEEWERENMRWYILAEAKEERKLDQAAVVP